MRLDRDGCLLDVAKIGLATLIERSGNTNQDGVGFLELGKIRCGAEVAAVDELLNLILLNVLYVRLAGVEHRDFGGIGIETSDPVAGFCQKQRPWESHLTPSGNCKV